MRENPPKMQKILNFQCNFHPTKQPLKCNMRPYLESSLYVVSKSALTFEFLVCLSRLFGCQRHLVILPRCAEIRQKRKKNVIFNLNSTQLDVENVKKKNCPQLLYTINQKKNNSHFTQTQFCHFQLYLMSSIYRYDLIEIAIEQGVCD